MDDDVSEVVVTNINVFLRETVLTIARSSCCRISRWMRQSAVLPSEVKQPPSLLSLFHLHGKSVGAAATGSLRVRSPKDHSFLSLLLRPQPKLKKACGGCEKSCKTIVMDSLKAFSVTCSLEKTVWE